MKKYVLILTTLAAFLFLQTGVMAQTVNQTAEWMRVRSDNGEFSVEVPARDYGFFADDSGFSVSDTYNEYQLERARMFSIYSGRTLITFESYKANKKALGIIRGTDKKSVDAVESERGDGAARIKQITVKTDKSYAVRQYFASKNYIYILTAASRDGETPEMKRFLDSLVFKAENSGAAAGNSADGAVAFSALKVTKIEVEESSEPYKRPDVAKSPPTAKDENLLPVLIVWKPAPSYTNAARQTSENGVAAMRITFSEKGYVSKISLLKTLKGGLTRQAFFAALRMKFLPSEKDGKPLTVAMTVEYSYEFY